MVLVVKNLLANAGRLKRHEFNPWVRKIPWRRIWQPILLEYSCLENPMDRETWWTAVHRVTQNWEQLKNLVHKQGPERILHKIFS